MFDDKKITQAVTLADAYDRAYPNQTLQELYDAGDLPICNCSECNKELIPTKYSIQRGLEVKLGLLSATFPMPVASQIKGRPICYKCLSYYPNMS